MFDLILKVKTTMKINLWVVGCLTEELYNVFPTGRYITLGTYLTKTISSSVKLGGHSLLVGGTAATCAIIYKVDVYFALDPYLYKR